MAVGQFVYPQIRVLRNRRSFQRQDGCSRFEQYSRALLSTTAQKTMPFDLTNEECPARL